MLDVQTFSVSSPDHAGSMSKDAVPSSDPSYSVDESRSIGHDIHLLPQQDDIFDASRQPAKSIARDSAKPASTSEGTSELSEPQQAAREESPQQAQMPMYATNKATDLSATLSCSSRVVLQHASDILDAALASNETGSLSAGILAAVKALGSADLVDPDNAMLLQVSCPVQVDSMSLCWLSFQHTQGEADG